MITGAEEWSKSSGILITKDSSLNGLWTRTLVTKSAYDLDEFARFLVAHFEAHVDSSVLAV